METELQEQDVTQIIVDVWKTVLSLDLNPSIVDKEFDYRQALLASISIQGAWNGMISLRVSAEHAKNIASFIFEKEQQALEQDEIVDAIAEMVNIVGGNIKAILPTPSTLGLPVVKEIASADEQNAKAMMSMLFAIAENAADIRLNIRKEG